MKLSTIHLEDFGPYVDQTINFDQPLNVIRGDLAQGKTKLSQAIQLSFAKICAGIDGKGSGFRDTSTLHRVDGEAVKKEVESAGFKFVGQSEVLRNPNDPHTAKVFDPSIRGHTDQFVFKFRKPG